MERETGVEPATSSLGSWHSTTELLPRFAIGGVAMRLYQHMTVTADWGVAARLASVVFQKEVTEGTLAAMERRRSTQQCVNLRAKAVFPGFLCGIGDHYETIADPAGQEVAGRPLRNSKQRL